MENHMLRGQAMKAYGYIRCSTTLQSSEGVTLKNQAQRIQDWCKANGHELVQVFEDAGLSGSKVARREGLKQALEAVKAAKGILVVYSLSRLSRSITDACQITDGLQKAGASLASLSERVDLTTASGTMLFQMLCVFASGERMQLVERVKSAMQYKKRQGKRVGTVPFGWSLGSDLETLVEHEEEQKTLRMIVAMDGKDKSLREIVEELEAKMRRTKNGGSWKRETVRQILKRKAGLKLAA
jgi:site-specific DNA recombinase